MLKLQMYRCGMSAIPDDFSTALEQLGESYRPVLEESIRAQAAALGLPREALSVQVGPDPYTDTLTNFAELLATPEGVIAVEVVAPRGRSAMQVRQSPSEGPPAPFTLTLYGIGTGELGPLLTAAASSLSSRYEFELSPFRYRSPRFEQLLGEGMSTTSAPSSAEAAGAELLADPVVRRGALAIATSGGGLLVSDLTKQFAPADQGRADDIKDALETVGLVNTELVVICSRNASQVLRAPSRAALERMSDAGAKCACGRALLDERVEDAVDLSELGRKLLSGSWWMSALLIQTLHSLGIEYDAIVVEQKSNGEEMDCFADISGELCLFELKDKEFSLGNAYSFGAKVGIYQPPHAIVVTTAHVGNDAKEHFDRSQSAGQHERFAADAPSQISYIEGLDNLPTELESLIESIYTGDARGALRGCLSFATVAAPSLIEALRAPHAEPAALALP